MQYSSVICYERTVPWKIKWTFCFVLSRGAQYSVRNVRNTSKWVGVLYSYSRTKRVARSTLHVLSYETILCPIAYLYTTSLSLHCANSFLLLLWSRASSGLAWRSLFAVCNWQSWKLFLTPLMQLVDSTQSVQSVRSVNGDLMHSLRQNSNGQAPSLSGGAAGMSEKLFHSWSNVSRRGSVPLQVAWVLTATASVTRSACTFLFLRDFECTEPSWQHSATFPGATESTICVTFSTVSKSECAYAV